MKLLSQQPLGHRQRRWYPLPLRVYELLEGGTYSNAGKRGCMFERLPAQSVGLLSHTVRGVSNGDLGVNDGGG